MSKNRETVIWKSPSGLYKMGAYDYYYVNTDSPDFDDEWDVEYNFDRFEFCVIGPSADYCIKKYSSVRGNAGMYAVLEDLPEYIEEISRLEAMFQEYWDNALPLLQRSNYGLR
jgi:hypothetical protein